MAMMFHPDLGNVQYELHEVSEEPGEQVAQVIGLMRRYAMEDAGSQVIRADLHKAVGGLGSLSDEDTAGAIFHHVRGRVSFLKDEHTASPLQSLTDVPIVEALVRPVDMAGMCNGGGCRRVGDCDDFAMYTAALLLASGIPCSYVTVKADPVDPSRYSHVYVAAYPNSGRIALDTSHGDYPGWEAAAVYGRQEWPVGGIRAVLPWIAAVAVAAWVLFRKSRVWRMSWA